MAIILIISLLSFIGMARVDWSDQPFGLYEQRKRKEPRFNSHLE